MLTGAENAEAGPSRTRRSSRVSRSPPRHSAEPQSPRESSGDTSSGSGDDYSVDDASEDGSTSDHEIPPCPEEAKPKRKYTRNRFLAPRRPLKKDFRNVKGFEWYAEEFERHLKQTVRHYQGALDTRRIGSSAAQGYEDTLTLPELALWKPAEKGRFYAALARHSRLRPDLIALDVQTKREFEVVQFIQLLEKLREKTDKEKYKPAEARKWRNHLMWSGAYEAPELVQEDEDKLGQLLQRLEPTAQDLPNSFDKLKGRATKHMDDWDREILNTWGEDFTLSHMEVTADLLHLSDVTALKRFLDPSAGSDSDNEDDVSKRENEQIDVLNEIAKKERTPEERQTLRTLLNRRRNRQLYRRRQLNKRGWSDEAIDRDGGPDAVYLASQPGGGAKRKGKGAQAEVVDPELADLKTLGLESYLENRGWEMFNYDRMAQFIELYQSAYGVQSTDVEPGTSFGLIAPVYRLLYEFLSKLIRRSIFAAGGTRNAEIDEEHVETALALGGITDPHHALRTSIRQCQRLSHVAQAREDGTDFGSNGGDRSDIDDEVGAQGDSGEGEDELEPEPGQGDAADDEELENDREGSEDDEHAGVATADCKAFRRNPYAQAQVRPARRPRGKPPLLRSLQEVSIRPPIIKEPPPDSDIWLPIRTISDDEDEALDEKLEAVDAALDAVMACQLLGAAKSTAALHLDDLSWSTDAAVHGKRFKERREAVRVPRDLQRKLTDAQDGESHKHHTLTIAYSKLQTKVSTARHRRAVIARVTLRAPTFQADRLAKRERARPSIPRHILAMEYQTDPDMDDEVERIFKPEPTGPRYTRRWKRKPVEEMEPEEPRGKKRRAPVSSDEEEEWEASGDSSGGYSTDEDTALPIVAPANEDGMDVDGDSDYTPQLGDVEADEPSLDVFAGDDALDSGSDENSMAIRPLGGDDALDSDDNEQRKPAEADMSTESLVNGHDALDSDDEGTPEVGPADLSANGLVGGEDALDLSVDVDRSAELVGGDDVLESDDEPQLHILSSPSPKANGHSSSPKSPPTTLSVAHNTPTRGKRYSPPLHHTSSLAPPAFFVRKRAVDSDSEESQDSDAEVDERVRALAAQLSRPTPGERGSEFESESEPESKDDESDEEEDTKLKINGYSSRSASPAYASGAAFDKVEGDVTGESWMLGGDDALDSDSD